MRPRRWFALLGLVACAGCASTDPVFLTAEGRHLRETPPAPFRIAIASVSIRDTARTGAPTDTLDMRFDAADLRARLVADMKALNASTEVFVIEDDGDAETRQADLVLQPRLTACRFAHVGVSSNAWLSTALWLTTWIGGLAVSDTEYDAHVRVDWDIINRHSSTRVASIGSVSNSTDLSFLNRHSLVSFGTLQSLLLPPFLTADDARVTRNALARHAVSHLAAQITNYLKNHLGGDERELLGLVRIEHPQNGADVGARVRLEGSITAREPIVGIDMFLNDEQRPIASLGSTLLWSAERQRIGSLYEQPVPDVAIPLRSGRNHVTIEFELSNSGRSSRTFVFWNGKRGDKS